jgi:hypothetical protein
MLARWISFALITTLAGCAAPDRTNLEPITVRVSGFGTYENATKDRLNPRNRLLARRASQLDAYRNLAERVYGTVIYGSSTVSDFVLKNDTFRTYVESYIRGAKVVAVNEHSDGVVESVMELRLEPRFRACVANSADSQVRMRCAMPLPRYSDNQGDVESRSVDSLYYID